VLVLAPDGRLRYGTPAGEAWCARLAAAERGGHVPLPTALWAAVAGLRAAPAGTPAATLVVPTPAGAVRVEASPGGADGAVAVVLAPAGLPAPPEVPPAWPLTPREREVVALLVRDRSTRGIAAALGVSAKTVETHLGHAYERLGVGGRGPLLARFFREAYWPAVHDPPAPDQPG
jgi:DNA-binding CsgD family transcriptional regulator